MFTCLLDASYTRKVHQDHAMSDFLLFPVLVFSDGFQNCIHIMAVQRIVCIFDRQNDLNAESMLNDAESSDHDYAQDAAAMVDGCFT